GRGALVEKRANDFHDDGKAIQGQVHVVWADGELLQDVEAECSEVIRESLLMLTESRLAPEVRKSSLHDLAPSPPPPTGGIPSRAALTLDGRSVCLEGAPLSQFGLGPAASLDARLVQPA